MSSAATVLKLPTVGILEHSLGQSHCSVFPTIRSPSPSEKSVSVIDQATGYDVFDLALELVKKVENLIFQRFYPDSKEEFAV